MDHSPDSLLEIILEDVSEIIKNLGRFTVNSEALESSCEFYRAILTYTKYNQDYVKKFFEVKPNFNSFTTDCRKTNSDSLSEMLISDNSKFVDFAHLVEDKLDFPVYLLPCKYNSLHEMMQSLAEKVLDLIKKIVKKLSWEETIPVLLQNRSIVTDLLIDENEI